MPLTANVSDSEASVMLSPSRLFSSSMFGSKVVPFSLGRFKLGLDPGYFLPVVGWGSVKFSMEELEEIRTFGRGRRRSPEVPRNFSFP